MKANDENINSDRININNDNNKNNDHKTPFFIRCLTSGLFLFLLFFIPFLATIAIKRQGYDKNNMLLYSAAAFCIASNLISIRMIFLHMFHWHLPNIQIYIVIILFMAPAFSTCSFVAIQYHSFGVYLHVLLDLYESIVLFAFFYMFIEMMGGEVNTVSILSEKDQSFAKHKCLCYCCCPVVKMGNPFYQEVKWGTLQFIILSTLSAFTVLIFYPLGYYDEDYFKWNNAYTYVTVLGIFSMVWAMYSIFMFFHAVKDELIHPKNWHPVRKFITFKLIIAISTIQTKILSVLVQYDVIKGVEQWNSEEVASALQHYLICIEMVIMAVANSFVFSYKECLPQEDHNLHLRNMDGNATKPLRDDLV